MANNNTETKYVKWNTFIAITAVLTSTFVSIYTIHKQNNFWKYQNAIVTKQQYTQIKIKKIEELNKVFNEFTMQPFQKIDMWMRMGGILADVAKIYPTPALQNQLYEWLSMAAKNRDIITDLRSNLIWHLETLSPLFSEEIVNNGKELAETVRGYEILNLTPEDINDINASSKLSEKIEEIMKKKNPDFQNNPLFPKFRSLIEKMYLQVKSELNIS